MAKHNPDETQRIRQRILGVYNLMEGAKTPEEFDAAKRRLDALLTKYNIDLDTFFEQKKSICWFRYRDKWERRILTQTAFKVVNPEGKLATYKSAARRNQMGFELTAEQEVDMRLLYEAYCKAWREEMEMLMKAFLAKHRIFSEKGSSGGDDEELTPERLEYLKRLWSRMDGLKSIKDPRSVGYLSKGE